MPRAARLAAVLLLALPALVTAAPQSGAPRLDPKTVSALPSHIQHVAPAVVGIHVEVPSDRPSAATLGAERWGSGVLFDAAGYALTVSYVLIDAARVDVVLRDGRKVEGKVAGLDLESGLGVIKLEGPGPWPAASLGDSTRMAVGDITGDGLTDIVVANGGRYITAYARTGGAPLSGWPKNFLSGQTLTQPILVPIAGQAGLAVAFGQTSPDSVKLHVVGGNGSSGTIVMSAGPAADAVISLSSSNPSVASVPATTTVPANSFTGTFVISTSAVTACLVSEPSASEATAASKSTGRRLSGSTRLWSPSSLPW